MKKLTHPQLGLLVLVAMAAQLCTATVMSDEARATTANNSLTSLDEQQESVVAADAESVISVDNYELVLQNVMTILGGEEFDTLQTQVRDLYASEDIGDPDVVVPGMTIVDGDDSDSARVGFKNFQCNAGGTFQLVYGLNGSSDSHLDEGTFTNCQVSNVTYNGEFVSRSDRYAATFEFQNFSVVSGNGTEINIAGSKTVYFDSGEALNSWSITAFDKLSPDGSTAITDYSREVTAIAVNAFERTLAAGFSVAAPWSLGSVLTVTTIDNFVNNNETSSARYVAGTLSVQANDGSALTVTAGNGDANTFQVQVTSQGETSLFDVRWSEGNQLPCVSVSSSDSTLGCR